MPSIKAVNKKHHAAKKWLRQRDNQFAADIQTAPIAGAELPECVRSFPLGLVEQNGTYSLVALFGVMPGQNLFVAPAGKWAGQYVPAVLRAYPFRLAETGEGSLALCVDDDSGLVKDLTAPEEGIPFFDGEGKPHPQTQKMADFLTLTHRGIQQMQKAAAVLAELNLLEPWPLKVKDGEVEKTLTGISRVNEQTLNALEGHELVKLRDGGALAVAYGQLLSMGNIALLGQLGHLHRQHQIQKQDADAKAAQMAVPSPLSDDSGELNIDWSQFDRNE